jgi:hypothetical protein
VTPKVLEVSSFVGLLLYLALVPVCLLLIEECYGGIGDHGSIGPTGPSIEGVDLITDIPENQQNKLPEAHLLWTSRKQ